jgi:hypothetical protein
MTGQSGGATIDDPASSTHFSDIFLYSRNIPDVRESECEVPSLVIVLNEPISTLNDIFDSKKKNLFSFQGQLVLLMRRMSLSCILRMNQNMILFMFIRCINIMHFERKYMGM